MWTGALVLNNYTTLTYWLQVVGNAHQRPHPGTSPRLVSKTKWRVSVVSKGLLYRGRHPSKCMRNGVAEEAEDLVREDNGSKGTTAKCEAHSGHSLDEEDLWPASVEGIRAPPRTYL